MLSGEGAEQSEVDQMVAVGIEEYAVIGTSLVTMGQDILEKLPTLHISQYKAERAFMGEYRKVFSKKQRGGR